MKEREITCIVCPSGCKMTAKTEEDGSVTVTGNSCKRGYSYAVLEMTHPVRTMTTTVFIKNRNAVLAVKAVNIPKEKQTEAMRIISQASFDAPVHSGDILIKDLFGSDLVATASIE